MLTKEDIDTHLILACTGLPGLKHDNLWVTAAPACMPMQAQGKVCPSPLR